MKNRWNNLRHYIALRLLALAVIIVPMDEIGLRLCWDLSKYLTTEKTLLDGEIAELERKQRALKNPTTSDEEK